MSEKDINKFKEETKSIFSIFRKIAIENILSSKELFILKNQLINSLYGYKNCDPDLTENLNIKIKSLITKEVRSNRKYTLYLETPLRIFTICVLIFMLYNLIKIIIK